MQKSFMQKKWKKKHQLANEKSVNLIITSMQSSKYLFIARTKISLTQTRKDSEICTRPQYYLSRLKIKLAKQRLSGVAASSLILSLNSYPISAGLGPRSNRLNTHTHTHTHRQPKANPLKEFATFGANYHCPLGNCARTPLSRQGVCAQKLQALLRIPCTLKRRRLTAATTANVHENLVD